jgi:hypothetical protein
VISPAVITGLKACLGDQPGGEEERMERKKNTCRRLKEVLDETDYCVNIRCGIAGLSWLNYQKILEDFPMLQK